MAYEVVDICCPGCGNPVTTGDKICIYCKRPVIISTFQSVNTMPMGQLNRYARAYQKELLQHPNNTELNRSIAMCYLKLGMYDKAQKAFDKLIETDFDNAENYFYAAITTLQGKKAFLNYRSAIDKAMEYLNAALMIEPLGIYYYFLAYIKYDYFERKSLNIRPNYREELINANEVGLSRYDIEQLFSILRVQKPTIF